MKLRNKILRRAAAQENRSANRPAQPRGKATATAAAQPPPEPSSLTPELDGSTPPDDDAADALLALGAPQAPPVRQQQPQPQRHAAAPQPPQRHAAAPQPAPIYDAAAAAWLGANGLSPLLDLGALRLGLATPRTAGATPHLARLSSTATLELARTPLPHDERFPAQPTRPDFGQHPAAAEALACQLVSPASLPRMPLRPAARPAPAGQEPGQHPAPPMVRVVLPPPPSGPLPTSSDILLYAHPALVPDLGLPAVVWGQPWPGPRSVVALAAAAAAAPSPATGAGATRTAAIRAASSYGSFEPSPPGSLVSPHTQYWPPPAVDSSGGLTRDRSRRQRRQRTHSPSFHEWSDDEEAPAEAARSRSRRRRADSTSDEEMEFLNWCALYVWRGWVVDVGGRQAPDYLRGSITHRHHTPHSLQHRIGQRRQRQRRLRCQPLEHGQPAGSQQPGHAARQRQGRRQRR